MNSIPDAKLVGEAAPVSVDYGLRRQTREFVAGWRELMRHEWHAEAVSALHEEIEKIAAAADESGAKEIADPALEMTVYLCSFVDEGVQPDATQQHELQSLVDVLADVCGMAPMLRMANKRLPEHKHWHALYLRHNEEEIPGFVAHLGQRSFIVRQCRDLQHLLLTLDTLSPDVLVVDEAFIADLNGLVEAVERKRPPHKDPALCLVLAREADESRAAFAQRAGANAILGERDPIAIAARIDELLAQRHALGYRVLIVEDDRGQAKFCESILRHRGMVTSICDAAAHVPVALTEFKPDLVLLDLYLPDSNGIEVAQRIREQPGTAFLPIVFLSGEHDLDLRFNAISIGADDFITKPVKPRHLITAVESRVRRARQLSVRTPGESGERRGNLCGRESFAREVLRVAREEQERCPTLALIAVDEPERVGRDAGFVASGAIAQQFAAALAAEIKGMRMLCASGELKYIVVRSPQNQNAAREEYETLRKLLDARLWGSSEFARRLHFSVGCIRLPPTALSLENLLDQVQALCTRAQQSGGARCEFDLRPPLALDEDVPQRMLRVALRGHSLGKAAHFSFQPILQLTGSVTGQYAARMHLAWQDAASGALTMDFAEYLSRAGRLNLTGQAERLYIRTLLELAQARKVSIQNLRIHLSVTIETVLDPAFAPWLAAELGSHAIPGGLLVLCLDEERLHEHSSAARPLLESLQRLGLRLGMKLRNFNQKMVHELLQIESIHVVNFHRAADAAWSWADCVAPVREARSLGKTVLASGLQSVAELGDVLRLGAHYAQADVLAEWSSEWNFDFTTIT